jgi:GT2 family glycosyltransferase
MKISAVVVTFNRLELLKKCVVALKAQTRELDHIFIINNGSTDGTLEWLFEQNDLCVINQNNSGGSGGFYRGIYEAYNDGADFVWCMDDDVRPYSDCLEYMLNNMPSNGGIVCPARLLDGRDVVFGGEVKHFNLLNPFSSMKKYYNNEFYSDSAIEVESMAFEGPLISKSVIDRIGFPEKDLFIFWDDTEYSYRAFINGFKIIYANSAKLFKEDLSLIGNNDKIKCRSWKYPYTLRNEVFFIKRYGRNKMFIYIYSGILLLRYIMGIIKHVLIKDGKYVYSDFNVILNAYKDGINGRLGKING